MATGTIKAYSPILTTRNFTSSPFSSQAGTGGRVDIPKLLGQLRFAEDQAVDIQLQSPADHIRLVAADDDALGLLEQELFPPLGQGDDHLAGDQVRVAAHIVEDLALQGGDDVEERRGPQVGAGNQAHVEPG